MSNIYLGIDPSLTGTGIAVLYRDKIIYQSKIVHKWSKKKESIFSIEKEENFTKETMEKTDKDILCSKQPEDVVVQHYDFVYHYFNELTRLMEVVSQLKDIYVGIEVPMGSHGGNAVVIQRIFASLVLSLNNQEYTKYDIQSYTPTQVKKHVIRGAAKKSLVIKYLLVNFNIDIDDDDIGDAAGAALLRQHKLEALSE